MPDKYDDAIKWLVAGKSFQNEEYGPDHVYISPMEHAWADSLHPAYCLFKYVTPTGRPAYRVDMHPCGCLTQVKAGAKAWTDALTSLIQADPDLPIDGKDIRVEHLESFARWQRSIDKELGR